MAKLSRYERIQKEIKELESLIPDSKKFGDKSNYMFAVKAANQKKGYDIGKKILNLRKQSVKLEKEMGTKYSKGAADLYIGDDISGSLPVNPDYQEQFDPKSELSIAKRQYESNIVDKMTQTEANRALAIQERKRKSTNFVQTPSPTWGVIPPDSKSDAKPNLAQTPSPTWGIDQERAEWLHKTRNSPAAKAGMSDDMRWQARQNHLEFQKKRKNKKKLSIKD